MPLLDNPKHEIFSYDKVRDRVAEIMSAAAERAEISIASVTENLVRIAQKAEQLRDASGLSVARNAWMDAAKVNGLIIDKAENQPQCRSK
jgi:hypothetical protein